MDAAVRPLAALRASPWTVLVVVLLGSYASALNTTVVGVALTSIDDDLGAVGGPDIDWIVTGFLVGVVLVQPPAAWFADRVGRKQVFVATLATFGLGAALCLGATGMAFLVAGRFVQGLGAGGLIPVGMTLVYERFPAHRRGLALGVWGIGIAGAPAAGPPLGGWLVGTLGWRWLFGVFVVVAAVAALLAVVLLSETARPDGRRRFDGAGWAMGAIGLTGLLLACRRVPAVGVTASDVVLLTAASLAVLVVLVRRSLRVRDPIIELRMFASTPFAATMVVTALIAIPQYAQLTYLPVELQVVRDLDAAQVGLLLAPAAIGVAAMMPIGGWLADRVGPRAPAMTGASIVAVAMWLLAHVQIDDSEIDIAIALVVQGAGTGLAYVPTTVAAMNSVEPRYVAQSSVVTNMARQFFGAVGIAVLGAVIAAQLGEVAPAAVEPARAQPSYNRVFVIAFWVQAAAVVAATKMPGRSSTAGAATASLRSRAASY